MSKFSDFWKKDIAEKAVEAAGEFLPSYIKRLNISAGLPSKVVDASYAQKTPDSNSVGQSFAGPIPSSLLARQDLEPTTKTLVMNKDSDHELTIEIHNGSEETAKAVFEGCELSQIIAEMEFMGHKIFKTPDMMDANGHNIGCYVVLGHDTSLQVFFSMEHAQSYIQSVLAMKKGVVEETQKDLIEISEDASDGMTSKAELIARIKGIQKKRQKATISTRGGYAGKSFLDSYKALTRK